jgi:asparagine synthase (glutamine-hydrolysing)
MCGITGILIFDHDEKSQLQNVEAATSCIKKRGPDSGGTLLFPEAALGHRRLSIIDTSDAASQPFKDNSNRYTIVFNGEIFNYKTLRTELESKGHNFRSASDTEVLLQLYISHKENCLDLLDGEFAFAIYDSQEKELFLARDRFGIKPLFFYKDDKRFVFASDLNSILAYNVPKKIDHASLRVYLHLNYIPAPHSIFQHVKKLGSGTWMRIKSKELEVQPYYKPVITPPQKVSYESAQEQLRTLMENSVRFRMVADVPLGAFLSGGLDSSIITAIAAKQTDKLHTFSIGFKDEPFFDETRYAALVAKMHNTEHTVFSLSNDDLFSNLHNVLENLEEPFADSSALAVNILSMHTRKTVKVALSGDGADELFGGYNKHAAEFRAREGGIGSQLIRSAYPILKRLPKSRNSKAGNKIRQMQKFSEGIKLDQKERYWRWAGFTNDDNLLLDAAEQNFEQRKKELLKEISNNYNSVLLTDTLLVLENDMLVKTDRMSMSHGLEVRVPFLDHKLVDFAFSLPAEYKIDRTQRKKILKDAFRNELPEELYHRGKQGFEVPLLKWFRGELSSMINDELLHPDFIKQQQIFIPEAIEDLKKELFSSSPNDSVARIWALIVFQYWWKKNFSA